MSDLVIFETPEQMNAHFRRLDFAKRRAERRRSSSRARHRAVLRGAPPTLDRKSAAAGDRDD